MEKQSILFVDDEESILEIAKEFFEQKNYKVFTAGNGLEAIALLDRERIDCCFTDINMPEMDGLELAEEIRKKDNTLPVVIMTGYPSLENTLQTLKNGVVDFLIKPINLNQMELCLKRVLRERELFINNVLLKKEVENKKRIEQLNVQLSTKVDELTRLNKIMAEFTGGYSSEDVFRKLLDMAVEISGGDASALYIVNDNRDYNNIFLSSEKGDFLKKYPVPASLIFETAEGGLPVLVAGNSDEKLIPCEIKSLMLTPLKIREKTFAVIATGVFDSGISFGEKELFYISFMCQKAAYAIENLALYENIYDNLFSTLYAFVTAIEARDNYTSLHSKRVAALAVKLGKELRCSEEDLDVLHFAGRLHDIGKIGVRDGVLLKNGRLTEDEFEEIKKHPVIGANIVGKLGLWSREEAIIRYHHERYDGTGYPEGLKGEDIPYLARITSVVDAYDAMASDRAYRKKLPESEIFANLEKGSGTQFDPEMVRVFLKIAKKEKKLFNEDFADDEYIFG
ncbi:MAG: HD domain-containing phosphohydrolase [Desulfobacteraceae bacterium]|jgi:putative nucleotidyltransferase with HDIG domain